MNQKTTTIKIDAHITTVRPYGKVKAFATITLENSFMIRGVKVIDGPNGLFAAMPNHRSSSGEYKDTCYPVTRELREQINSAVLEAYRKELVQAGEPSFYTEESLLEKGGNANE